MRRRSLAALQAKILEAVLDVFDDPEPTDAVKLQVAEIALGMSIQALHMADDHIKYLQGVITELEGKA